jgi:hypothetical protein
MVDPARITRRGWAALAAAAGLPARANAAAAQPAADQPPTPEARLDRAAARLARCPVPRETQPAIQFLP